MSIALDLPSPCSRRQASQLDRQSLRELVVPQLYSSKDAKAGMREELKEMRPNSRKTPLTPFRQSPGIPRKLGPPGDLEEALQLAKATSAGILVHGTSYSVRAITVLRLRPVDEYLILESAEGESDNGARL